MQAGKTLSPEVVGTLLLVLRPAVALLPVKAKRGHLKLAKSSRKLFRLMFSGEQVAPHAGVVGLKCHNRYPLLNTSLN